MRERTTRSPARSPRPTHALALTCAIVAACGLAPVALALAPRPGEPVAVVTLFPDGPVPKTVATSGAPILWLSRGGHVAVLGSDGRDVAADLRRAGAFLVLAAGPLGACLPGLRLPSTLTGPPQP
ncbi:NADH dehydrogenase [Methylorubrum extorquens]|nr:NADH dehydrogenase [Methylorubrum extorquens]